MNTLWHATWYTFSYLVFFYSMAIMASYLVLVWLSYREQKRKEKEVPDDETLKYMLKSSPLTPAVSVIAPAYNEHVNIITNAYSLLGLDYPSFEVISVNDGSKDDTLNLLKREFDLEEVSLSVEYKVPCTRIVAVYKSKKERFSNLTVVDKVNGGRKADSTNAGINVCQTPYFVCTDADCIIDPMALYRMMWLVINSHEPMIGVGATMLMSNDCDIDWVKRQVAVTDENKRLDDLNKKEETADEKGKTPSLPVRFFDWLVNLPVLWGILACFQQLEYLRSFLIGKLGWSGLNALPNISGGFGLFDTEVAISSGGYDRTSMAEDMDMLLRMVTYMCNNDLPFRVGQVTQACCWTKGPVSAKGLFNQRSRWGRGLFEIIVNHWEMLFRPKYGVIGAVTLPYLFVFEFLAGFIEFVGFWYSVWLFFHGAINWNTFFYILGMIYLFSVLMTFVLMFFDYRTKAVTWKHRARRYVKFLLLSLVEPFYHFTIVHITLWGYLNYLRNKGTVWKTIER